MEKLITFIGFEIRGLLLGLMLLVAYQLLTGKINAKEMLFDKETNNISPGRVQLLLFTLTGAIYYLSQVASNQNPGQLPHVPEELLWVLAGSNTVYLGGKTSSLLPSIFGQKSKSNK